ncbi:MAG: two-component regulator propeller domain-containing protein [Bacteroidota bacterium]
MLKQLPHVTILLLSILLSSTIAFPQGEPTLRVKQLDYKDGLVGRRAMAAVQDSDGFMWIATVDALNRYDGIRFQHFNQSNSALNYREVNVRELFEDEQGYLWLLYYDNI